MACRQTGFAMLAETNVQEVMDLAPVAHLAAIKGRVPFLNFFDGFRTSHEIQKVAVWDYDDLNDMLDWDAVKAFREQRSEPRASRTMRGSARERRYLLPEPRGFQQVLRRPARRSSRSTWTKVNAKLGTDYQLFNYYGAPDADRVIVAMGSVCDVAEEVIDYLTAHGEKVGLVKVRLYRPFCADKLLSPPSPRPPRRSPSLTAPRSPARMGEPLYLDVVTALANVRP